MEKLMGVSFVELHSATPQELCNLYLEFSVEQLLNNTIRGIDSSMSMSEEDKNEFLTFFLPSYRKHLSNALVDILTADYFDKLRAIYDTEERYNIGIYLQDSVGDISRKVAGVMENVMQDVVNPKALTN